MKSRILQEIILDSLAGFSQDAGELCSALVGLHRLER